MRFVYWKIILALALGGLDAWWSHRLGMTDPEVLKAAGDIFKALHAPAVFALPGWVTLLLRGGVTEGWWLIAPLILNSAAVGFAIGWWLDWRLDERARGRRGLKDSFWRTFGQPDGPLAGLVARLMNRGNRKINAYAVQALDVQLGDRVLDAGFGGGVSFPLALAKLGTGSITGVDPSLAVIRLARKRWARQLASGRVRLSIGSVDSLPFRDDSFDKALTVNAVYFWPDLVAGFKELRRVLADGGRLVVATRSEAAIAELRDYGFRAYSERDLARALFKAGFNKLEVEDRPDGRWGAKLIAAWTTPDEKPEADGLLSEEELDEIELDLGALLDLQG